jgi:hypothetical protein
MSEPFHVADRLALIKYNRMEIETIHKIPMVATRECRVRDNGSSLASAAVCGVVRRHPSLVTCTQSRAHATHHTLTITTPRSTIQHWTRAGVQHFKQITLLAA